MRKSGFAVKLLALGAGMTMPALADEAPAPQDLETRLAAALHAAHPTLDLAIDLEGCRLRTTVSMVSPMPMTTTLTVWLADLETAPDRVRRDEGQRMANGSGRTWRDHEVVYRWRPETLEIHAADIARWRRDMDSLLAEPDFGDDALAELALLDRQMRDFMDAMSRGDYGAFFERNIGWGVGAAPWGEEIFGVEEIVSEGVLSPLVFTFSDAVIDDLLVDLDRYARSVCPEP